MIRVRPRCVMLLGGGTGRTRTAIATGTPTPRPVLARRARHHGDSPAMSGRPRGGQPLAAPQPRVRPRLRAVLRRGRPPRRRPSGPRALAGAGNPRSARQRRPGNRHSPRPAGPTGRPAGPAPQGGGQERQSAAVLARPPSSTYLTVRPQGGTGPDPQAADHAAEGRAPEPEERAPSSARTTRAQEA